ncbi:MAG: acyl carrier protein [Glaciimonas sp.]|nr:acyl carrier protein [Glaciimonas sp.]
MKSESIATYDTKLQNEVAEMIVQGLNLELDAAAINPDEPLYGDGLGLDSIDILEVALLISKRYGIQLRANNDDNHRIFTSLRSLTQYISAQKSA